MHPATPQEWRQLLRLLLSQRLELNALEGALTRAGILTATHIHAIRTQATDTANAWSSQENDDVLALFRAHSLPNASMHVPPAEP